MEVMVSKKRVENVCKEVGFDQCFIVEGKNHGGGLALLWRQSISVSILGSSINFIDAKVDVGHRFTWERGHRSDRWVGERLIWLLALMNDVYGIQLPSFFTLKQLHRIILRSSYRNLVVEEWYNKVGIGSSDCQEVIQAIQNCISLEQNERLVLDFTEEEVKTALSSMHPDKAPGPDGLRKKIGNGNDTSVCRDPWLMDNSNPFIEISMPKELQEIQVSALMLPHGGDWDVDLIKDLFSDRDVALILSIPLSQRNYADSWCIDSGMVLRDSDAKFIVAKSVKQQRVQIDAFAAKLISFKEALTWVKEHGWQNVLLESDSIQVVNVVNHQITVNSP
ncbi:hypothetical protein DITRI_Ditri10aG0050800 [Diplodiscus trichospermus]